MSQKKRSKRRDDDATHHDNEVLRHHIEEASVHLHAAEVLTTGRTLQHHEAAADAEQFLRTAQRNLYRLYRRYGGQRH